MGQAGTHGGHFYTEKQSSGGVLQKGCSERFHKIHRKVSMPEPPSW